MSEQVKNGSIDNDVIETLQKEQIDLGLSSQEQWNRTELNFYCELLSQFRKLNNNMEKVYETINMIGADRLTKYFEEFTKNWKEEEKKIKVRNITDKSHYKKKPKVEKK